jgi:hypothetical protein
MEKEEKQEDNGSNSSSEQSFEEEIGSEEGTTLVATDDTNPTIKILQWQNAHLHKSLGKWQDKYRDLQESYQLEVEKIRMNMTAENGKLKKASDQKHQELESTLQQSIATNELLVEQNVLLAGQLAKRDSLIINLVGNPQVVDGQHIEFQDIEQGIRGLSDMDKLLLIEIVATKLEDEKV